MQCLHDSRLASKLATLSPTSQDQVVRYLHALSARQYARGTIEAVITVTKRLCAAKMTATTYKLLDVRAKQRLP